MRITVLGAGALGSIISALLTRSGEDVTLVARGERARQLRAEGVRVGGLCNLLVPVRIADSPESLTQADALIVCVKTYDTAAALAQLSNLRPALALSLQNGVLKNEQLAAAFGADSTVGAAANFSGEVLADGSVLFTRNEMIYAGELHGGASVRVNALIEALVKSGINAMASERIRTVEWSKFVTWLGLTPVGVLSRLPTHLYTQDPDLCRLLVTLTKEAATLADTLGVELQDSGGLFIPEALARGSLEEGVGKLQAVGRAMQASGTTAHKMSALQDVERGRQLEIEETLGDAIRRANQLDLAVPTLDACYRLMAALSRGLVRRSLPA